jgi:hypothetical protein
MKTYTYTVTAAPDNGGYLINGVVNPPLDLQSNATYIFNVQAPGHPFYIKTDRVLGEGAVYDFQVTGNGTSQGLVKIVLPMGPVPKLFYQCGNHLTMGGSLTNVKHIDTSIKHALGDQLPAFVSSEYPMFQRFLEAYYEWLASPGQVDYNLQNVKSNTDVDTSIDLYLQQLEAEFLKQIPKDIEIDKKFLIKNIRSFYASKGTEKSYQFLFNILFNENVEFYYPKNDILRASDGKWETVTSIRFLNDNNYDVFALTGETIYQDYVYTNPSTNLEETRTWATAKIERIIQFFLGDTLITEAYLSNVTGLGDFLVSSSDAEDDRKYIYYKDTENNPYEFRIVPMVTTIEVENPGTGYNAGTLLNITTAPGDSGVGASAQISSIIPGNIQALNIVSRGQDYKVNDPVVFESSAEVGGSGASAFVSQVSVDGMKYAAGSIDFSGRGIGGSPILNTEVADILNGDITTFAKSYIFKVEGPGTWTASGLLSNISSELYGGTMKFDYFNVWVGDDLTAIQSALVADADIAVTDQSIISNYSLNKDVIDGDKFIRIEFTASISGATYDAGAGQTAEMGVSFTSNFLADGSIKELKMANFGSGYRRVPTATIQSSSGFGAAILSDGSNIGKIKEVKLLNQNFGALYYQNPTIDLTDGGNGDAVVSLGTGSIAQHPGIFRNDDGHLSEAKYLQDNKYYQTFSYVLRTGLSIENYRDTIKKLVHPSGMELFGEVFITNNLRAGLYNNFTSDPNDLIVSERLGGLQIPRFKKTIMLFKTDFVNTVTYGGGVKEGQLYERPDIIAQNTSIHRRIVLESPNIGVDPTDIEVFSFPVLKFPIQTDIENIIIDNQVAITKTITRSLHKDQGGSIDVIMSERDTRKRFIIQKQMDTVAGPQTSHITPEISLLAPQILNLNSTYTRGIRDLTATDLKASSDRPIILSPRILKSLDLSIGIQREIHRQWTTHNYLLTAPQAVEVIALPVEPKTNTLTISVGYKELRDYIDDIIGDIENVVIRDYDPTFLQTTVSAVQKRLIKKELDLGISSSSYYILQLQKSANLTGEYVTSIHGSVPVESMIKLQPVGLNIPAELVQADVQYNDSTIDYIIVKNINVDVTTSVKNKLTISNNYDVSVQTAPSQLLNKQQNLFNGFIYKIEENTIESLDPDNTQIRSIANSQLVSTTLMGYIRDGDDNILGAL